jgi:hypothetical protein
MNRANKTMKPIKQYKGFTLCISKRGFGYHRPCGIGCSAAYGICRKRKILRVMISNIFRQQYMYGVEESFNRWIFIDIPLSFKQKEEKP